jgi:FADH2 O2-dependent halogenase
LAGEDWALLPHTAGFVDPLHSTGMAHSLCGVERLVHILDRQWQADTRAGALHNYGDVLALELDLIDELVAICFANFDQFDLHVMATMLYFAAVTTYERLRYEGKSSLAFLCADQTEIRGLLHAACTSIARLPSTSSHDTIDQVRRHVVSLIAPINRVGLLDLTFANMYHHTVAPM